jgi:exonuclease SbcD
MKIAHISDIHLDEHSRFEETKGILEWFWREIERLQPDLVTVGGDSSPVSVRPMTPLERNTLASFYQELSAVCPVYIVRGNHDAAEGDIDIFSRVECRHQIKAFSSPGIVIGETRTGQPFVVGTLPWPSKGFLMARAKTDGVRLDDVNAACREAMKAILLGLQAGMAQSASPGAAKILLSHINVAGCDAGGFTLIGQDVEVSQMDLEATGADVVLLGHIHKRQSFGPRIHYPGSPRRVDFGEEGEEKGYLLVTVDPGQAPVVEFRPTPVRQMQTIRVTVTDAGVQASGPIEAGADARILIDVDEQRRSSIDLRELLNTLNADGAHEVKTEFRVTPNQRVRAPEMQAAATDADRLRAFLGTLDAHIDQLTTDRLLLKLGQISGGAA